MDIDKEDGYKFPPIKMWKSIESRCETHHESHGQNYREHLEKHHRHGVEA